MNPSLASAVSFALSTVLFTALFFIIHPLPTTADLASMPWWAPIGGLVGALQVYMGFTHVNKVGAGLFMPSSAVSSIWSEILNTPPRMRSDYKWSHAPEMPLSER